MAIMHRATNQCLAFRRQNQLPDVFNLGYVQRQRICHEGVRGKLAYLPHMSLLASAHMLLPLLKISRKSRLLEGTIIVEEDIKTLYSIPKRTKQGWRLFPPDKPRIWELGQEIGEQIREGKKQERQHSGTHKDPRPHIRRAHWHTYKTGRRVWKDNETPIPQMVTAKWLPPIPVAMAADDLLES